MSIDWDNITSEAYLSVLELKIDTFPITEKQIKCKGVRIVSFQEYSQKTGISIRDITCNYELEDAFLISGLRPDLKMILYNNEIYNRRMRHTLWHEVGHIKCNHKKHGEKEEVEAHFFASQANAPNALIQELVTRGYDINMGFLIDEFGLSKESAIKKMNYFKRHHFSHINEFDDIIIQQFSDYLNKNYPPKAKNYFDDYFDELEKNREKW